MHPIMTARNFNVTQSLLENYLPLPEVKWTNAEKKLQMTIKAISFGDAGKSITAVKYKVENLSENIQKIRLALAVRPLQLNPPWQHGGFSKITSAEFTDSGRALKINDSIELLSSIEPSDYAVLSKNVGDIFSQFSNENLPSSKTAVDADGVVTAGQTYDFSISPDSYEEIVLIFPLHPESLNEAVKISKTNFFDKNLLKLAEFWKKTLGDWSIIISDTKITNLVRSNLAYMLLNRDFKAAQPGPRNYARAWMRDGSISSATYLRYGLNNISRDYLDWFSSLLDNSGFIPPIVESGKKEIPGWARDWKEYDSQGEYAFAIREYYEFSKDRNFLRKHYPRVITALKFMRALIEKRLTKEYENTEYYGILPESNSHEGYFPAKHSYWDDFWGIRGYKDGIALARAINDIKTETRLIKELNEFRANVYRSIKMVIEKKKIEYMPGCAELGDPDATSTSISIMACGELSEMLDDPLLAKTLDSTYSKYLDGIKNRWEGGKWGSFTPYEVRNIDALVRMRRRDDAQKLLAFMIGELVRPSNWNLWGEVTHYDLRTGSYIGDMPHTWVGAGFCNAVRSMFVYEEDSHVVIGGGITDKWINDTVTVLNMPTWFGKVSYTISKNELEEVSMKLSGTANPKGGFIIRLPYGEDTAVKINGKDVVKSGRDIIYYGRLPVAIELKMK